jgi:hypothetical protein
LEDSVRLRRGYGGPVGGQARRRLQNLMRNAESSLSDLVHAAGDGS